MERAEIAKVVVAAAPYSIDKPYDYLIPEELLKKAQVGVRVTVPFGRGNRSSEGFLLARAEGEKTASLKSLLSVLDAEPVLDESGIALAFFLRQRYFCTMYEALKTVLPSGLWYQLRESYRLTDPSEPWEKLLSRCGQLRGADGILRTLQECGGKASLAELGAEQDERRKSAVRLLVKEQVLTVETAAQRKISDKTRRMAELAVDAEEATAEAERKKRTAPVRSAALQMLADAGRISSAELCYYTGATLRTLRGLEKAGFLRFSEEEELRIPRVEDQAASAPPLQLNQEQQEAYEAISQAVQEEQPAVFLLQGVTGSGKTAVYLQLVKSVIETGKQAIVLVPEIVLTPQMMQKFVSHFGDRVVMLHSSLKMSERYDQWKRIRRGEVQVVLGTRSAIFAPLQKVGLVILDEEQEGSYQSENPPRYHARDVAKFRCAQSRAVLVLGSATPAVESAYAAQTGIYRHQFLRKRYNEQALPQVTIADLRKEIRSGNAGTVSMVLREEIGKNLSAGEQTILFLNRRGNSRMLLCGECGKVPECRRCSVPLTYHSANHRLMCHYCGYSEPMIERCPDCGGMMKHVGIGTQRVEEELRQMFPEIEILRMDADTVSGNHMQLLERFEKEKIPILLGTQMVAKGLDFENVTLVGVLSADLSLYVDHYRAAERTFSLLTQVVGRAGRGGKLGRAVIQTYTPENEVIQSAAHQDYDRFYEGEIRLRRIRRYPPFADLFTLTVSGLDEGAVLRAAVRLKETLGQILQGEEFRKMDPEVLGPAPAPVLKVNNRFRYRITLVGKNDKILRRRLAWLLKDFSSRSENRGLNIFADCNAME